jgi:hypothetical protein
MSHNQHLLPCNHIAPKGNKHRPFSVTTIFISFETTSSHLVTDMEAIIHARLFALFSVEMLDKHKFPQPVHKLFSINTDVILNYYISYPQLVHMLS